MRLGQQAQALVSKVQRLRNEARDLRAAAAELLPMVQQYRGEARQLNQRRVSLLIRASNLERQAEQIVERQKWLERRKTPTKPRFFQMRMQGLGQHVGPQAALRAEAVKVLLAQGIIQLPPGFVPRTSIAWPKSSGKEKIAMATGLAALTATLLYAVLAS